MSPQSQPDFTASQGSVPLFSGELRGEMLIPGGVWAFGIRMILFLVGVGIDILSWLLPTLIVGSIISVTWSFAKRRRFRNLVTNQDLLSLFEGVRRDLGKGNDIELWQRNIDRQVFLSTGNVLFKAILFSDSAIADFLEKKDKGRILLARAVLEIEKKRPIARLLTDVLLFTVFAFTESMAFGMIHFLFYSFLTSMVSILVLAVLGLCFVVVAIISRTKTSIDDTIERLYGTSPAAATMDVLYGLPISEEMIEKAKREGEEGPSRRRKSLRNAAGAAVLVAPVSFAAFMLTSFYMVFAVQFSLIMAAVVAGTAFFLAYITSNMWPMLTMGRGPRSTEWDIELPFAQEVQGFLNGQEGYERLTVKGVKSRFDSKAGLVILRLKPDYREETLHGVMPQMMEDLHDVGLLGPLILADLKIHELESRERRIGYRVLAVAIPFLAISVVWSFLSSDIFGAFFNSILLLLVYLALSMIPLAYLTLWRRKAVVKAEVEIVRTYPKYREALRILIRNHHTLPYGMTSYRTRLERIDRQLGIHADQDIHM